MYIQFYYQDGSLPHSACQPESARGSAVMLAMCLTLQAHPSCAWFAIVLLVCVLLKTGMLFKHSCFFAALKHGFGMSTSSLNNFCMAFTLKQSGFHLLKGIHLNLL